MRTTAEKTFNHQDTKITKGNNVRKVRCFCYYDLVLLVSWWFMALLSSMVRELP